MEASRGLGSAARRARSARASAMRSASPALAASRGRLTRPTEAATAKPLPCSRRAAATRRSSASIERTSSPARAQKVVPLGAVGDRLVAHRAAQLVGQADEQRVAGAVPEGGVVGGEAVQAGEQEGRGAAAGEVRIEVGAKARAPGEPGHGVGLGRGRRAVAQGVVGAPEQAGGGRASRRRATRATATMITSSARSAPDFSARRGCGPHRRRRPAARRPPSRRTACPHWRAAPRPRPRRQSAAVAAIAGHGVPGVAGEHDARAERDVLAGQAVGVAAAVPALVAGAHDAADRPQRRRPRRRCARR